MRSVKYLLAAGAASLLSTAALAADMAIMPPPPAYYAPPAAEEFSGWYLRGDIGFSNQQVKHLSNALEANLLSQTQFADFSSAGIFGLGVGYHFNNWFRGDITGEYRGKATLNGYEMNTFPNGGVLGNGSNKYTANKSEWLVLANAYADLGTWYGVTPFIGAGVGTANVKISNYTDIGLTSGGFGTGPSSAYAPDASKWNFAWALYAGLGYRISPNVTIELAYRYLDLGNGITGDVATYTGVNNIYNPTTFQNITSHDLKLGVRWNLDTGSYLPPPPLVRKG